MKYIVLVCDGMADYPVKELAGRTPIEAARTPNMDFIAKHGRIGRVRTVPAGFTPGSDIAQVSIFGYDPKKYYTGRGPLEAANLGVELEEDDVAFRCNLITASGDILRDYSAGHISSREAEIIIKFIDQSLGTNRIKFYPGISYRHLMVVKRGAEDHLEKISCKPPHDISGKSISKHFPKGEGSDILIHLMNESRRLLDKHEINLVRLDLKENPGNMIWLWGQGKRPNMESFYDKYGIKGSVISAVDLIKGLGKLLGLKVINVPGATGYYDTNYEGKAQAALKALQHNDFVFVHLEAADEAGHNGDLREKITAIERFDQLILGKMLNELKRKSNFRIMVLPDHATPVDLKTHVSDPVPFGIFGQNIIARGFLGYSEKEALKSDLYFDKGHELMNYFMKQAE
ncbi:MAG: cofactor-independent phosphoglycerate mutase [Candidatus Omnitrophica bacterium ADurb.Bin205]|nr:MAG: cofactor-independent phosphoglycerate mutase [Candidatus Omnitrophica bacterium ADurb.Bin205]